MIETQPRPTIRTLVASFLFTDLVGFSKGTAADQYAAKAKLSGVLRRHLAALKETDYWIKDTGDGALIAFVSNPEHALYMALALGQEYGGTAESASGSLRTGLHLGTVKESIDVEARRNFIGDGINAAKRIMDFAQPGQITASRSFFEAIANLEAAYSALFEHVGASDDKHGRAHELYTLSPSASVLERLRVDLAAEAGTVAEASATNQASGSPAPAAAEGSRASRKRLAIVAGTAALILVAIAVTWWQRAPSERAGPVAAPAASTAAPAPTTNDRAVSTRPPEPAIPSAIEAKDAEQPSSAPAAGAAPSVTPPARVDTTQKGAAEAPRTAAASTRSAQEKPHVTAPPATGTNSGPSSPRCTRIVEKAALGEPLTPEEKRELANSCR